jgi:hypothetical protein
MPHGFGCLLGCGPRRVRGSGPLVIGHQMRFLSGSTKGSDRQRGGWQAPSLPQCYHKQPAFCQPPGAAA